jgi:hypothetical protein
MTIGTITRSEIGYFRRDRERKKQVMKSSYEKMFNKDWKLARVDGRHACPSFNLVPNQSEVTGSEGGILRIESIAVKLY